MWVRFHYDYHVHHLAISSTESSDSINSELLLKDTQYDKGSDTVAILPKRLMKPEVPTMCSTLNRMSYGEWQSVPYCWCAVLCSESSKDVLAWYMCTTLLLLLIPCWVLRPAETSRDHTEIVSVVYTILREISSTLAGDYSRDLKFFLLAFTLQTTAMQNNESPTHNFKNILTLVDYHCEY